MALAALAFADAILGRQAEGDLDLAQHVHSHLQQQDDLEGAKGVEGGAANLQIREDRGDGEDGLLAGEGGGGEEGARVCEQVGVHDAVQVDEADVAGQKLEDGGHVGWRCGVGSCGGGGV